MPNRVSDMPVTTAWGNASAMAALVSLAVSRQRERKSRWIYTALSPLASDSFFLRSINSLTSATNPGRSVSHSSLWHSCNIALNLLVKKGLFNNSPQMFAFCHMEIGRYDCRLNFLYKQST